MKHSTKKDKGTTIDKLRSKIKDSGCFWRLRDGRNGRLGGFRRLRKSTDCLLIGIILFSLYPFLDRVTINRSLKPTDANARRVKQIYWFSVAEEALNP